MYSAPLCAVLISLVAVPLIVLSRNRPNLREFWTLAAAFIKWGLVISMLPGVLHGQDYAITLFEIVPRVGLSLRVDAAGLFFALVSSTLWIITSFYSIGYMRGVEASKQTRYFASFAVCLSATMGIAFAANLVTFLIFYEMLSIATYPLVIHNETPEALRSGHKYLAYALSAGLLLILAVIWTYQISGTVDFQAGGFLHSQLGNARTFQILFLLFLAGAGVKAGLMPFHSWLPAAMVAPTPVSALLHAVAVVKAGVFAIIRIVGFVFGPGFLTEIGSWQVLAWLSVITLLSASLIALRQNELKRRLAYSTIAHLSYILLGLSLLGMSAWQGGLLHLANHATLKITLFFVAGAIYVKTRLQHISDLDGIGRKMPITMGAFTVASLGLTGIPPLNGFISKWYLASGTLEGQAPLFFAFLLLASLLCGAYLLPIVYRAYFREAQDGAPALDEAHPLLLIPLVLTALASVALGLFPNGVMHLYDLSTTVASSVLGVSP